MTELEKVGSQSKNDKMHELADEMAREAEAEAAAAAGGNDEDIGLYEDELSSGVIKPSIALRDDPHYRINPNRFHGWFRSYVRQDWGTINVHEGGELEELRAGWIELFFDLIYVAGIVHISSEAVYSLDHYVTEGSTSTSDSSHRRLASGCVDTTEDGYYESDNYDFLFCTFFQFGILCCAWNEQVAIESRFANEQAIDAWLRFLVMTSILLMGSAIRDSQNYFQFFLFSFILVKFFTILTYSKISLIPRARNHCLVNIFMSGIEVILSAIFLMTVDGEAITWIYVYLSVYLVTYFGAYAQWIPWPGVAGVAIPVNVPHIAERFGLFTMLILGESIISLMTADNTSVEYGFFGWVSLCFVSFLLTYSVGLLYFSCQPSEEKILSGLDTHAMRAGRWRARLFVTSHTWLQFGLLGFGIGSKIISQHLSNGKDQAVDVMMAGYSLLVVCMSLNGIRISHPFEKRTKWVWGVRIVCLIVMAVVPAFWHEINQFGIMVIITICVLIQVLIDEEGKEIRKENKTERKEKVKEAVHRQTTEIKRSATQLSSRTSSQHSNNNDIVAGYSAASSGSIGVKIKTPLKNDENGNDNDNDSGNNNNNNEDDEKDNNDYKKARKNRQSKDDSNIPTEIDMEPKHSRTKSRENRAHTAGNLQAPMGRHLKKQYSGVGFM